MKNKKIYTHELHQMSRTIDALEDGRLRFMCIGINNELSIDNHSWIDIKDLRQSPRFRTMSDELNVAIKPIIDKYKKLLKQDMKEMSLQFVTYEELDK